MATNYLTRFLAPVALSLSLLISGCANNNAQSESDMKRLLLLNLTYMSEHNETYPDLTSADTIKAELAPLLAKQQAAEPDKNWSDGIFIDDVSGQPFVPNANLARVNMAKLDAPMNTIAFYAPQPSGDKRLVGYADGHIEWVDESQWPIKKIGGMAK